MQWFFWTSLLLPLQSVGPVQVCFWVLAIEELSYLNKTFGADRLRYTGLPQLTQNRGLLPVPTSKLCSEVAALGGLI